MFLNPRSRIVAKKKSAGINMASEIRNILTESPELSGAQVVQELKSRFPKEKINEGSAKVAFSNARRIMGIGGKRKKAVRKRRPAARPETTVNMNALQAARKYINEVGDVQVARAALEQLVRLQVD
jgi:hypothetical protein